MTKLRFKFFFIFITIAKTIFGVGFVSCQDKSISVETIQLSKSATVPIFCGILSNGVLTKKEIMGSAFFINSDGWLMTARHIIERWEALQKTEEKCALAVFITTGITTGEREDSASIRKNTFVVSQKHKSTNRYIDIAVIKLNTNPFSIDSLKGKINFVKFGKYKRIQDGTPIAMTGFPMQFEAPVTSQGYIGSYADWNEIIILDIKAWPGNSGSPIYLNSGKVIGMLLAGEKEQGGAPPIAHSNAVIFKFLSDCKIRFYKDE